MKKVSIVPHYKKRITLLERDFDSIVKELKETPLRKAEYDAIEQDLRDLVYAMKDGVDGL